MFCFCFFCFFKFYDPEAIFVLQFDRRSVAGLDKEPDLIHMEAHMPDGSEYPEHSHQRVVINRISLGINPSQKTAFIPPLRQEEKLEFGTLRINNISLVERDTD